MLGKSPFLIHLAYSFHAKVVRTLPRTIFKERFRAFRMYKRISLMQVKHHVYWQVFVAVGLLLNAVWPLPSSIAPPTFVDVCHNGFILSIDSDALADHLGHGDVQLIDDDGDGYYKDISICSSLVDCNDSDPNITSCASNLTIGQPHPIYGGMIFELDGIGGGKLVNSVPILGLNYGYVGVQHITPWTTSTTDGFTNTDLLLAVHDLFNPPVMVRAKGPEWYIPAIEELELIYKVAYDSGGGTFRDGFYLSSTDAGQASMLAYLFDPNLPRIVPYSHYGNQAHTLSIRSF